jgi:hypothetical protein
LDTDYPETNRPETNRPETNRPETNHPETNRPETNRPETNRPETNRPETNRPESKRPETNRPEVWSVTLESYKPGPLKPKVEKRQSFRPALAKTQAVNREIFGRATKKPKLASSESPDPQGTTAPPEAPEAHAAAPKAPTKRGQLIREPLEAIKSRLGQAKRASLAPQPETFAELAELWELNLPETAALPVPQNGDPIEKPQDGPSQTSNWSPAATLAQAPADEASAEETSADEDATDETAIGEAATDGVAFDGAATDGFPESDDLIQAPSRPSLGELARVTMELRLRLALFAMVGIFASFGLVMGGYLLPILPVALASLVGVATSLWRLSLIQERRYQSFARWLLPSFRAKPAGDPVAGPGPDRGSNPGPNSGPTSEPNIGPDSCYGPDHFAGPELGPDPFESDQFAPWEPLTDQAFPTGLPEESLQDSQVNPSRRVEAPFATLPDNPNHLTDSGTTFPGYQDAAAVGTAEGEEKKENPDE